MLQLGHSFEIIFFNKCSNAIKVKQRLAAIVFMLFMIGSLSTFLLVSLIYNRQDTYSDEVIMSLVKLGYDLMVIAVNIFILVWLHKILRNFKNSKLQDQMRKVKI